LPRARRTSPPPRLVRLIRGADRPLRRPSVVVAILLVGSVTASVLGVEPIGAQVALTPAPIEADVFLAVPVPPSADPSPIGRPVLVRPRPPLELEPAPSLQPPAVVRFRPRDGWTGVARAAALSVRFTQPMDHVSTGHAFAASIGAAPITGTYRWAESDTVLVFQPVSALTYGATVQLSVAAGARSRAGVELTSARSVTFTVEVRRVPAVPPAPPAPPAASVWHWPLVGPITQGFGESLTQYGVHQGIDIDGDTGDRVRAARTGTVVVAGHYDECGGLEVHIDHGDGLTSWYRHLSRIDVAVGARVTAGTIIGAVGDTGCSLGSHLHFAIRDGSTFVDPLRYLPAR
jgi:murein DD-endopeptidase MepM/ murein hydrolase activator NlpD